MNALLDFPERPQLELTRCVQCGSFHCGVVACRFTGIRNDRLCHVPGCENEGEHVCESCDQRICFEHAQFDREIGAHFCAVVDFAAGPPFRFYCDESFNADVQAGKDRLDFSEPLPSGLARSATIEERK